MYSTLAQRPTAALGGPSFNFKARRSAAVRCCKSAGAGLSVALTLLLRLGRSGVLADVLSPDGLPLRFGDLGLGEQSFVNILLYGLSKG